jgi:membrane protein
MKRLYVRIRKWKISRLTAATAKKVILPGFEGLTLFEVGVFFARGLMRGELRTRAGSMAYSFFLAIFPALIFLFTLIPYIPIDNFQVLLFENLRGLMPKSAFAAVEGTITEILGNQNFSLLSVGFVIALYFSTNGFMSMMDSFNKSIHVKERRPDWKQRLLAFGFVIVTTITLIISISLIVGSERLIDNIVHKDKIQHFTIAVGRWLILALLFMFVIATNYRFGPARPMHKHFFSPGVLLAAILMILTSLAFAWFVNNFGRYNKLYGSIGSVLVVLIWIYYNSMMLIIGFELDAAIAGARDNRLSLLEQEEREIQREENQV